jgi:hypothetical protein
VAGSEERLRSLLATLDECRAVLDQAGSDAAGLLSLDILELRLELHRVTDSELKALCDQAAPANRTALDGKPDQGLPPPYLQLVRQTASSRQDF